MYFGAMPLDDAEGAILAHAVRLPGSLVLKKGHILSAANILALRQAGIDPVIVAKLDSGDVGEDKAAAIIAASVAGSGVGVGPAATGRVNLHATVSGLTLVNADAVHALNLLDEAITLATLAPMVAVEAGQMLATIKVIPFAASAQSVDAGAELARNCVAVAPFRPLSAGLVQTRLPGMRGQVLAKATAVTGDRLVALGGRLAQEWRVSHRVDAVAEALLQGITSGLSPLLMIGATAITDRRDVLPEAIRQAGGEIIHFGMPVDPGNLILIGRIDAVPVIGLPGCARSPKLNGFDWALQRLAASQPIGARDIMAMGVGGLLAEIKTRPLPREQAAAAQTLPVHGLILAAGMSRRMGSNKLLMEFQGRPILLHVVETALQSQLAGVSVVVGHEADGVATLLRPLKTSIVSAPDYSQGLSASLKAGLAALPSDAQAVLVLLGDMPRVKATTLARLLAEFAPASRRSICIPAYLGQRGNPVLWDRRYVNEMMELTGDQGARSLLPRYADQVHIVDVDDPGILLDVDTPEALAALKSVRVD